MIKQITLNRLFFLVIVVLALAAGYFQAAWQTEQKKYARLEKDYQLLIENCSTKD